MSKIQVVDHTNHGLYVWQLPDGRYLTDDEGNHLSIASTKYDVKKMNRLATVAAHYGFPDGKPVFLAGHRKVSESEYQHQRERMAAGLLPDEYDFGAVQDELRFKQQHEG